MLNEDGIVVATGCYAQTDTAGATKDEAIDIVIGNNHKAEIVQIVEAYAKDMVKLTKVDNLSVPVEYEESSIDHSDSRTRVDIKIQDGCNQFCSYCIIPFARGKIRSLALSEVKRQAEQLVNFGYKEIVCIKFPTNVFKSKESDCNFVAISFLFAFLPHPVAVTIEKIIVADKNIAANLLNFFIYNSFPKKQNYNDHIIDEPCDIDVASFSKFY